MGSALANPPNREIDFGFVCVACVRAKLREGVRDVASPGAGPGGPLRWWPRRPPAAPPCFGRLCRLLVLLGSNGFYDILRALI